MNAGNQKELVETKETGNRSVTTDVLLFEKNWTFSEARPGQNIFGLSDAAWSTWTCYDKRQPGT